MSANTATTNHFHLGSDEVHCWCVRLDAPPDTTGSFYTVLTDDERNRSARFRYKRDRERFIVAHGVLRNILGHYLNIQPADLRFAYNSFGKPELSPEFSSLIRFNLSHSADLALIAIAPLTDVGVDLEYVESQLDYAEIARQFFSPTEVTRLSRFPKRLQAQAFFNCWTKKEAFVKACGKGLSMPLTDFSVPLSTDSEHAFEDSRGTLYSLYSLQPADGYVGALAIKGNGWRVSQRQWRF